jgi:2-methylisocitrate lyase-like PEP mutase family enzyme
MRAAIHAAQSVLRELKSTGSLEGIFKRLSGWEERHDLLRMPEIQALEKKYGISEKSRTGLES